MDYFSKLDKIIAKERPKLKESSRNLYIRNIKKLSKLDNDKGDINFLMDFNKVEKLLEDKSNHTKKTYYASIVVVLKALKESDEIIKKYSDAMYNLQEKYEKDITKQEKTEKQNKNWLDFDQLVSVMVDLRRLVFYKKLLQKEKLNKAELMLLQQWLVSSLYLLEPEQNPPVRLSYATMKIIKFKDYEKIEDKKDNYLVIKSRNNKFFSFNDYKTSGSYGTKEIRVGSKLNTVLNHWLKYNKTGNLLLNSKLEPMNNNGLTKFINKIFEKTGKSISVSMIRHSYLSNRYKADQEDRQKISEHMLHSTSEQTNYIKK